MGCFIRYVCVCFIGIALYSESVHAQAFFTIKGATFVATAPKQQGLAAYDAIPLKGRHKQLVFKPCLDIRVQTRGQIRADQTLARLYFFNSLHQPISRPIPPHPANRDPGNHAMPAFFYANQMDHIFFAVPPGIMTQRDWQAVVVFGDSNEMAAWVYPHGSLHLFDFPEKELVLNPRRIEREMAVDPVVEHIVKTPNPQQPQLTLLMRPPIGITDTSQAQGVLAMCLIGNNVADIKRRLQLVSSGDDVGGLLQFADRHKLIILCWGSRRLWDAYKNWDDLDRSTQDVMGASFDEIARYWARGIDELARKYHFPNKDFLLHGSSDAAQYAKRLALRQPQYFLAVHIHIPSSFDRPTSEARHLLWCLTSGERDYGYERSKRFLFKCRMLGYPIIYKAFVGLGHAPHPIANQLGLAFFEHALTLKESKQAWEKMDHKTPTSIEATPRSWPRSYSHPFAYGDIVNQEVFPFGQQDMIPERYRTPLPTEDIMRIWQKI